MRGAAPKTDAFSSPVQESVRGSETLRQSLPMLDIEGPSSVFVRELLYFLIFNIYACMIGKYTGLIGSFIGMI